MIKPIKKKKILINAEYLSQTGFSTVCENICEILKPHYEITVLDYSRQHDYVFAANGIFLAGNNKPAHEDRFGVEKIISIMDNYDYILFINDIWNIDEMLTSIRLSQKTPPKIVLYFPIDAKEHFGFWYKNFDIVYKAVTYTNFAKDVISKAVLKDFSEKAQANELLSKVSIIPHGVNLGDYFKIEDKVSLRRELFKTDYYDHSYIILNANRNQPRKKLDITLRGFKEYLKIAKVPSFLYLHCSLIDSSIDVYGYAKSLGILDYLILSCSPENPKKKPNMSISEMNWIYNACDVGINTSIGEGWGLCSVEQASVGVPQIVPRHSACIEIFSEKEANFIDCETEIVQDNIMTLASLPSVESTANQIKLMSDFEYRKEKADNCYDKFNSDTYCWNGDIKDSWLSVFCQNQISV